jgi:hypothetical protein
VKYRTQVNAVHPSQILSLLPLEEALDILATEKDNYDRCLMQSSNLWIARVDGKVICFWGLAPPTILSDSAHLWLYTVEAIKGHEFAFVRRSQIEIEEMLKLYPTITGYTDAHRTKAIRWLKWLGASFGEPEGQMIPFVIGRKQ